MNDEQPVESPSQLGDRFWRELRELVQCGEISSEFAGHVIEDLFESHERGQKPVLKWSVWCAYLKEQQDLASLFAIRR